jgi:hypothetical protein
VQVVKNVTSFVHMRVITSVSSVHIEVTSVTCYVHMQVITSVSCVHIEVTTNVTCCVHVQLLHVLLHNLHPLFVKF